MQIGECEGDGMKFISRSFLLTSFLESSRSSSDLLSDEVEEGMRTLRACFLTLLCFGEKESGLDKSPLGFWFLETRVRVEGPSFVCPLSLVYQHHQESVASLERWLLGLRLDASCVPQSVCSPLKHTCTWFQELNL